MTTTMIANRGIASARHPTRHGMARVYPDPERQSCETLGGVGGMSTVECLVINSIGEPILRPLRSTPGIEVARQSVPDQHLPIHAAATAFVAEPSHMLE